MFKYYFFALKATLSNYLTLSDFLSKKDVEKGFVICDHGAGMASLGLQLYKDSTLSPSILLSQYACILGDMGIDNDDLDQPFELHDGLFMSMMSCDLIQTKNLAIERRTIADQLGILLKHDKARVEK
jgi:hypothetical protein